VSFADGFSTDPLRHKADYLKGLIQDHVRIKTNYNSRILNPLLKPLAAITLVMRKCNGFLSDKPFRFLSRKEMSSAE
jgi:hypothetical protein